MAIATEEKVEARVETSQTGAIEMNFLQNWVNSLPWLLREALIVGIIASPVAGIMILLKLIGV